MDQFRIGGVYRQIDGVVVSLNDWHDGVLGHAKPVDGSFSTGQRRLSDGRRVLFLDMPFHGNDLIPGELHQVNGQWVPVEEHDNGELSRAVAHLVGIKAKRDAERDPNAAMLSRDEAAMRKLIAKPAPAVAAVSPKPSPQGLSFSPDLLRGSDHLVRPEFGSASR